MNINYRHISDAIDFYTGLNYPVIDAPWFVSSKSISVTSPPNRRYYSGFLGTLVGSGEQSFIEMWLSQMLGKGKFQCATPCFRDEPRLTKFNHNYFFKVELIEILPVDVDESMSQMIADAASFFNSKFQQPITVVPTDIGWDIEWRGVELGSYGYREFQDMKWVYGTGCAEPRLSQLLEIERDNPL
jgi:hypothetical protein